MPAAIRYDSSNALCWHTSALISVSEVDFTSLDKRPEKVHKRLSGDWSDVNVQVRHVSVRKLLRVFESFMCSIVSHKTHTELYGFIFLNCANLFSSHCEFRAHGFLLLCG